MSHRGSKNKGMQKKKKAKEVTSDDVVLFGTLLGLFLQQGLLLFQLGALLLLGAHQLLALLHQLLLLLAEILVQLRFQLQLAVLGRSELGLLARELPLQRRDVACQSVQLGLLLGAASAYGEKRARGQGT